MKQIGIIGLGAMGSSIAKNLLSRGYRVKGYDIQASRTEALNHLGGTGVSSCKEAGKGSEAVILMVFNGEQVEDALFGTGELADTLTFGASVIVTASVGKPALETAAPRLADRGIHLVDAPVRASSHTAATGEMYIMAAADAQAMEANRQLLSDMGNTVVHVGSKPGMGQIAKTCMQSFFSLTFQTTFEILALGQAAGLNMPVLYDILNSTGAANGLFRNTAAQVASRTFEGTGNPLSILDKDAHIGLALAAEYGLDLPALKGTAQSFAASMKEYPTSDIWAGVRVLEEQAGIKIAFQLPPKA